MTRMLPAARRPRRIPVAPVLLGLGALLMAALPARAQITGVMGRALENGPNGGISSGKDPDAQFRKAPPPPALPGARSRPEAVAPAQRPASDMDPTEALFDAVNRGDIAAVREAVSRGADLRAHNILGLTAVDLSVDLGRSDITFLLLSLRGAAPVGGDAKALAGAGRAAPARAAAPPAARPVAQRAPEPASRPAPRPEPRPRVLASDGGTPRPSAGFLGFGP